MIVKQSHQITSIKSESHNKISIPNLIPNVKLFSLVGRGSGFNAGYNDGGDDRPWSGGYKWQPQTFLGTFYDGDQDVFTGVQQVWYILLYRVDIEWMQWNWNFNASAALIFGRP